MHTRTHTRAFTRGPQRSRTMRLSSVPQRITWTLTSNYKDEVLENAKSSCFFFQLFSSRSTITRSLVFRCLKGQKSHRFESFFSILPALRSKRTAFLFLPQTASSLERVSDSFTASQLSSTGKSNTAEYRNKEKSSRDATVVYRRQISTKDER